MKNTAKILILLCSIFILCSCTPKPEPETEGFDLSGKTFYNTAERFLDADDAKIWFGKDHSFVLTDSSADGSDEITGTWSVSENVCTLNVEHSSFGSFSKILFEIKDEDTLILKTSVHDSYSEDVYSTTRPERVQAPEPDDGSKTYYNIHDNSCSLTLRDDKTFLLKDSNGKDSIEVNGVYGEAGNVYMFSNFPKFNDRNGDMLYNFEFFIFNDEIVISMTDLYGSKQDDIFTLTGVLPEGFSEEQFNEKNFIDRWIHYPDGETLDIYLPYVDFGSDGRFEFTENFYSGMFTFTGTYEETDNGFICHVDEDSKIQGYKGGDVDTIVFEYTAPGTMMLKTEICMSREGDLFAQAH